MSALAAGASAADAALAAVVARERPQPPLRRTRRARRPSSGARPIRPPPIRPRRSAPDRPPTTDPPPTVPAFGRPAHDDSAPRLRAEPPRRAPALDVTRRRPHPDLQIRGAPLGVRRSRRVLRRGGCGSLRGDAAADGDVCGASLRWPRRRSLVAALKSDPSSGHGNRLRQHGTAVLLRLSLAGSSRFAPSTSPYAPSSLRGRARSHFHNWRRCRRPSTAFMGSSSTTVGCVNPPSASPQGPTAAKPALHAALPAPSEPEVPRRPFATPQIAVTDARTVVATVVPPAISSALPSCTAWASGPPATHGSRPSAYEPASGIACAPP